MADRLDSIDFWEKHRGHVYANKGGWTLGQGISNQGYSMLDELVGEASFFQVLILNVTGSLPEKRVAQWLENAFICLSWPDPRIWCNQIGALGGDARVKPVAAISAGCMASDSKLYGPGTLFDTARFLHSARSAVDDGASIADFVDSVAKVKGKLFVPGFARPIAQGDERVTAMQACADQLGFEDGLYLDLAYEIGSYLQPLYGGSLNLGGYMCAFMLDLGMSVEQGYRICSLCVNAGVSACYSEYRDKSAGSFLPLRCSDIDYVGVPERAVPCV